MSKEINYKNNPLHGVGLKEVLIELESQYGYEMLFAYLNVNCFKNNPSIESSVKFLKKTDWARDKVEAFYMYEFKSLPRVSSEQFSIPPRDRIVPEGQMPGEPKELSLEDADLLRERRESKSAERNQWAGQRSSYPARDNTRDNTRGDVWSSAGESSAKTVDPWGNAKNKT